MKLKEVLTKVHGILTAIPARHAIIGGMALAAHGVQRATNDIDFLIEEELIEVVRKKMIENGFKVIHESQEVLQFSGCGEVDFLIARRPMSRAMLAKQKKSHLFGIDCLDVEDLVGLKIQAYSNSPKRKMQDQADIDALFHKNRDLDYLQLKVYSDMFNAWIEIAAMLRIHGHKID